MLEIQIKNDFFVSTCKTFFYWGLSIMKTLMKVSFVVKANAELDVKLLFCADAGFK